MSNGWLIAGCGDTGSRVAARLVERGERVTALVRSVESCDALRQQGIDAIAVDLDSEAPPPGNYQRLIHLAPPPGKGEDDPRLAAVLTAYPSLDRLIYISTSGVYGDCQGEWVDETRECQPITARAKRRLAAEQRVARSGLHWNVLRAPGIYGPGRLPIERLREAEPILNDADSPWTNRIHVEDLAAAVLAVAEHAPSGRIYNVSDGMPTRMSAQYRILARLLDLPEPPQIGWQQAQADWSDLRLSFLRESRRLRNEQLCRDIGWRPVYPDLESGLRASLGETVAP